MSFAFLNSCKGRTIDYEERNKRLGVPEEPDSSSSNSELLAEAWGLTLSNIEVVRSGIYKFSFQSYYINSKTQGLNSNLEYLIDLTKAEAFDLTDFSPAKLECVERDQSGTCLKGNFLISLYIKSLMSTKTAQVIFNFNKETYELQTSVHSVFQKLRSIDSLSLNLQSDVGSINEKMEFIVDSEPTPQSFFYSRQEENQNRLRIRGGFSFYEEDIFQLEYVLSQMSISFVWSAQLNTVNIKRTRRNIFTGAEDALYYRLVKVSSNL